MAKFKNLSVGKASAWLFLVLFVVVVVAGVYFLMKQKSGGVVPLGSNATTTGQTTPDATARWLTYSDRQNNPQFKYPATFGANVWHPQFWPPKASVVPLGQDPVAAGCPTLNDGEPVTTTQLKINSIDYTLRTSSDVGAGQLYTSYCYVAQKNQKSYVLYFVIWSSNGCGNGNCGAYCDTPTEAECKALDRSAMIEKPIETIVSTFKF
jgi:hypothetical protein